MSEIITLQMHQKEFTLLGNQNILTDSVDFGYIWNSFFNKGGYDPIIPYAIDSKPINIWYTNEVGQKIYFQGMFVKDVNEIPDGYQLITFPASDFLVVTTEWMPTNDEAVGDNGNGRCNRYAEIVTIPEGYIRNDKEGSPLTLLEKENADTPEGSRYEVWIPLKKAN